MANFIFHLFGVGPSFKLPYVSLLIWPIGIKLILLLNWPTIGNCSIPQTYRNAYCTAECPIFISFGIYTTVLKILIFIQIIQISILSCPIFKFRVHDKGLFQINQRIAIIAFQAIKTSTVIEIFSKFFFCNRWFLPI